MSKSKNITPYYVKVHESRGYGNQPFKVLAERHEGANRKLQLFRQDSERGVFWIYAAHTYKDRETDLKSLEVKTSILEKAKKIGLKQ